MAKIKLIFKNNQEKNYVLSQKYFLLVAIAANSGCNFANGYCIDGCTFVNKIIFSEPLGYFVGRTLLVGLPVSLVLDSL
jgi:hypothetical protein